MLSREDNARLTRVERDTPMGTALRRYWIPALLARELPESDGAPVRVPLLGEDLTRTMRKPDAHPHPNPLSLQRARESVRFPLPLPGARAG